MRKLHIFIETSISSAKKKQGLYTNEYHFVDQYLKYILPEISAIDYDITDVGGKDKLWMFDNAMKQNDIHLYTVLASSLLTILKFQ